MNLIPATVVAIIFFAHVAVNVDPVSGSSATNGKHDYSEEQSDKAETKLVTKTIRRGGHSTDCYYDLRSDDSIRSQMETHKQHHFYQRQNMDGLTQSKKDPQLDIIIEGKLLQQMNTSRQQQIMEQESKWTKRRLARRRQYPSSYNQRQYPNDATITTENGNSYYNNNTKVEDSCNNQFFTGFLHGIVKWLQQILLSSYFFRSSSSDVENCGGGNTDYLDPASSIFFGKPVTSNMTTEAIALNTTNVTSYPDFDRASRIVGGREAGSSAAEFFSILLYWNYNSLEWEYMGCGGTLISSHHILTAAHCVKGRQGRLDAVFVNAYRPFHENNGDVPFHFSRVQKYTVHPSFRDGPNDSDVAIVTLEKPVKDRKQFSPIRLARPTHTIEDGDPVQIFGFGRTSESDKGQGVDTLRFGTLPFITNSACRKFFRSSQILPDMVCGGYPTSGGVDACQGDSGGPMTFKSKKDGKVYQVGTVSWGVGCGQARKPGVYASTQYHFDWIQKIVCNDVDESVICSANDEDETDEDDQVNLTEDGNVDDDSDRSSNTTESIVIDEMKTEGAQVCDDNEKRDGETCHYGGQCCSGTCSRIEDGSTTRVCRKRVS